MKHRHLVTSAAVCGMLVASAAFAAGTDANGDQPVKDTYITTKVKAELAKDRATKATDVKVTTVEGTMVLSGTVGSAAEKQKAEQDARSVKGVTDVRNELTVRQ